MRFQRLLIFVVCVFVLASCSGAPIPTKSTDECIAMMRDGKVKSVIFAPSETRMTDTDGRSWILTVRSDDSREAIFKAADEFNAGGGKTKIEVVEETAGGGFGWFWLVKAAPFGLVFLFFAFWAATLGVIVWSVKRLSRRGDRRSDNDETDCRHVT